MVIFIVPAEGGKNHSHIYPRHGHAGDIRLDVPEEAFGVERQDVQIPGVARVGTIGVPLSSREA